MVATTDVPARESRTARAREKVFHVKTYSRRAALTGIKEREPALEVDLRQISREDSSRGTHALEHGLAQSSKLLPQDE